jgi:hypothetical protein
MLHRYRPDPKVGWEEYWITFSGAIPQRGKSQKLLDGKIPFVGHNCTLHS